MKLWYAGEGAKRAAPDGVVGVNQQWEGQLYGCDNMASAIYVCLTNLLVHGENYF